MTEQKERDDGGPAFPFAYEEPPNDYGPGGPTAHTGMSLRDWFATHAPPAPEFWRTDMIRKSGKFAALSQGEKRAAWNYEYADAMLKARTEGDE